LEILIRKMDKEMVRHPKTSNRRTWLSTLEVKEQKEEIVRTGTLYWKLPSRSWNDGTQEMAPK
jgi:hypothetical protein